MILKVEIYANGAMVRIFHKDYVATRLYWKRDVFTEHRESYEYYFRPGKP